MAKKKAKACTRVKRVKITTLELAPSELIHLRDILTIKLPPDLKQTLSESLARVEDRELVEQTLWSKVTDACKEAGLPLENEAPDYVVIMTAPPELNVYPMNPEGDIVTEERDEDGQASGEE